MSCRHVPSSPVSAVTFTLAVAILLATTVTFGQSLPPVVPGFPNVTQTPGTILSGINQPQQGRVAIIAYHNGVLYTVPEVPSSQPNSDWRVRAWDLADPTAPVIQETFAVTPMPINAHGYFKSGDYLVIGANSQNGGPWSFRRASVGVNTKTSFPNHGGAGVRGNLFQPWFVGDTYWSYSAVSGDATLELRGEELARWDHLGQTGVIGHPFILGDLLIFASDQSRTGIATYDISDPSSPVLLDVLTTGGPGGYWPELWGSGDRLYAVFPYRTGGNGLRVVDLTDPTDLQLVADTPLPGDEAMYVQFQDEFAFAGSHKVDMRTFESVLNLNGRTTVRPDGTGVGIDTSQFALPIGNLLVTGGSGPFQGMAIWAHQAEPDTRGPSVGYHVPRAGRTAYPIGAPISLLIHETLETTTIVSGISFIVRPLGGAAIDGSLTYAFDDILTFTPDAPLAANTTYEVLLPEGGIKDAAGNGMEEYRFTFATGASIGGNRSPVVDSFGASLHPAIPGAPVSLDVAATDPENGALEYRYDAGDGSAQTAWSSDSSISHTYTLPGHYQATVQARDDAGAIASARATVTVLMPPTGPRPVSSTPIACDPTGRRVFKVNPDNDSITAIDADTLTVLYEVTVCADPRSVARSNQDELWIACHDDDRLRVLAASTGATVASIDLDYGSAPIAVATSTDGSIVFAATTAGGSGAGSEGSGTLRRFDAVTRTETGALTLGMDVRALAIASDDDILVSRFLSPRNHGEVWAVDATTMTLSATRRLPKIGGDFNRDGTAGGRGVANTIVGLAIAPGAGDAWIASNKPNTERGLFFANDLDSDNTVRNLVTRLDARFIRGRSGDDALHDEHAELLAEADTEQELVADELLQQLAKLPIQPVVAQI